MTVSRTVLSVLRKWEPGPRIAVGAAFFLSGAAGLVYELLWTRALGPLLGHTAIAAAAVAAAFMGGLALGALWGGRRADALSGGRILRLYAGLEVGVAAVAFLSTPALDLLRHFASVAGLYALSPSAQRLYWFGAAMLLFSIPTALMGATLPLLVKWWGEGNEGEQRAGFPYGVNLFGAMAGTALAGYWLIPALGLNRTCWVAILLNLAAAALAWPFGAPGSAPRPAAVQGAAGTRSPSSIAPDRPLLLFLFLTGAGAMVCQAGWTRAFSLVLGSSTYAFTAILLTVLAGLSFGSLFFDGWIRHWFPTRRALGGAAFFLAFSVLAFVPFFNRLPYQFVRLFPLSAHGPAVLQAVRLALCAFVAILPTVLMGMLYPWALAVSAGDGAVGARAGRLYAANTLGNIAGAVAAGLWFLPALGAEKTLLAAVLLFTAAGAAALLTSSSPARVSWAGGAVLLSLTGILVRPPWDPNILSSGVFIYAPQYQGVSMFSAFLDRISDNRLRFHKDGASSTVTVMETPWGERFLRVNGKTDASTGGDMVSQLLTAYLPRVFHAGRPRDALVIGFGSGVTVGALVEDPDVRRVDVAEIEPVVLEAAPFFAAVNREPWKSPKFHAVFADARQYLGATSKKYDLIVSEPSNPWIAGVSSLFTREAFQTVRGRLGDGGVFCQWFHSYSMGERDFKMVLATFASVFPHVQLLTGGGNDFFLLGSDAPWRLDYPRIAALFADHTVLSRDMGGFGWKHPFAFLTVTHVLGDADFRRYVAGAPIHTDDRPTLEFSAPAHLHAGENRAIDAGLEAARTTFTPDGLEGLPEDPSQRNALDILSGESFLRARRLPPAVDAFQKAMQANPRDPRVWSNVGRIQLMLNQPFQAEESFRTAIRLDPKYAPAWFHMGTLYLTQGLREKGLHALEEGLRRAPGDPMASMMVGQFYLESGRKAEARAIFNAALEKPGIPRDLRENLTQGTFLTK